jgi:predicted RNA-binding protein YlqC (UPF0109 family)
MKELLETIARALVDKPDEVEVNVVENEKSTVLELSVAPDDMGKVIGREGKIAKAIRTIIKSASIRSEKMVFVDIVDKKSEDE